MMQTDVDLAGRRAGPKRRDWRTLPATDKQRAALRRLHRIFRDVAPAIDPTSPGLTRGEASAEIDRLTAHWDRGRRALPRG